MRNREGRVSESRLLEDVLGLRLRELRVEFGEEGRVSSGWHARFFIEKRQYTKFSFDDIDGGLVICEVNEGPIDGFSHVFLLLEFEYV